MATFQIHEDDENNFPLLSAKLKELGPIQSKRVALGELNKNVADKRSLSLKVGPDGEKVETEKKEVGGKKLGKSVGGESKLLENPTQNLKKSSTSIENEVSAKVKGAESAISKENIGLKVAGSNVSSALQPFSKVQPFGEINALEKIDKKVDSPMIIEESSAKKVLLPPSIKLQLEDLFSCVAYKDCIFKYLKKRETLFRPKPYYMKRQPDVSYSMRSILVDWLVEVGEEYKLSNATLFSTVNYVDRFLSSMAVVRGKLQLLGTAAMLIAAKFEEIYPPEVGEFTYITDDTYTKGQVLRMENLILKVLDYNLSTPTPYTFVMHISTNRMPEKVMFLALYICELTLLEADPYLEVLPSLIACGAIALARHCLEYVEVWPHHLITETGYTLKQLAPVIQHLNGTHAKSFTSPQMSIRVKYRDVRFQVVSAIAHKKLSIRVES